MNNKIGSRIDAGEFLADIILFEYDRRAFNFFKKLNDLNAYISANYGNLKDEFALLDYPYEGTFYFESEKEKALYVHIRSPNKD